MKRQLVLLGSIAAVLAALCLLWLGLNLCESGRSSAGQGGEGENTAKALLGKNAAEIQSVFVEGADAFTVVRTEEGWSIVWERSEENEENQAGAERLGAHSGRNIWSQELLADFTKAVSYLYAEKIDDSENAAMYGLEHPGQKITVKWDGGDFTFFLGEDTPAGGGVYVMSSKQEGIYLVRDKYLAMLRQSPMYFLERRVMPKLARDVTEGIVPVRIRLGGSVREREIVLAYSSENGAFALEEEQGLYDRGLKQELPLEIVNSLATLQGLEAVSFSEPEKQPYSTMEFTWRDGNGQEKTSRIFASEPEGDFCYLLDEETGIVWRADNAALPWLNLEYGDLFSTYLLLPGMEEISRITLEGSGRRENYTVDAKEEVYTDSAGREIEGARFKKLYQSLLGVQAQEYTQQKPSEDAEVLLRITWEYGDGREPDVVELIQGPDLRMYLGLNGRAEFLADKRYLDIILWNVDKLATDEEMKSVF